MPAVLPTELRDAVPAAIRTAAALCALMGIGRAGYEWLALDSPQPAALTVGGGYLLISLSVHTRRLTAAVAGLLTTAAVAVAIGLWPVTVPLWEHFGIRYGGLPLLTAVAALIWSLAARPGGQPADHSAANQ
jgi:hypothetical protein